MRYFLERSGGDGSRFVAVTDPGSPLVDTARRARLPARVRERSEHRRALLGAVVLRPRARGAGGRERGGAPRRRPGGGAELRQQQRHERELRPLAGDRDGRAGAAGPRQADLRRGAADRELRPLGRAAGGGVHRQAGQGHPAGGRRAAGRPGLLRRRSRLRVPAQRRRARRGPRRAGGGAGPGGPPDDHASTCTARRTSAGSSSSPSSRPPWPAGCSASTRSTSRTCRRPRTTPPRCWRAATCRRSTPATWLRAARGGGAAALRGHPGLHVRRPRSSTPPWRSCAARSATPRRATTTFGYGPRYLHSTGQFHKGGPPTRACSWS